MATAATATTGVAAPPSYPMASIYVGDLAPEVTEAMLFEKFSTSGPVLSIRVCRDAVTRRSLGYAYVNFQQPSDAERALSTMNFDSLAGKPIRLMWSQRDPAARRSGNGNIFIKNLDKDIDNKNIFDTFSLFGSILSCKVATDDEGNSKGYGFIHFETDEAAQKAINSVNGMLLAGKKVFVGPFLPRSAREKERGDSPLRFTNVFVKNFDDKLDKAKLEELFSKFGKITSAIVMLDAEGKSKGFGFVAFAEPEAAAAAVEELNDSLVPDSDKKFFVGRAQKKSERLAELKRKFAAQKAERLQRYQGVNLYVKNLEETVDDEKLRALFEPFGKITSAKVMLDEANRSKGFGFVCYEKTEEASKASAELNGKVFGAKPLYVALAQRKEDRRAQLASQYMQRLAAMRNTGGMHGTIYTPAPGQGGYFVSSNVASGLRSYPPPSGDQRSQQPQAPWAAGYNAPHPSYMVPPQAGYPPGTRTRGVGGVAQQGQRGAYGAGQGARQGVVPRTQINPPHAGQRQVYPPQQQQARPPTNQQGRVESLNTQALAQASIGEQKQVLGDRVYYQIEKLFPGTVDASKVTGMLLEMDTSDLLLALQNDELLRGKVEEAVAALKNATASKQG